MYEDMIAIDREASESLQQQIRRQLAAGIVNRLFPLHEHLPSIRRLSAELGVSINTVALAYEALKQDGFVLSRPGSGFFVNSRALPDPGHAPAPRAPPVAADAPGRLDYRAFFDGRTFDLRRVAKPADCLVRYRYPFVCGLTDPSLFPIARWRECVRDSVNALEVGRWTTDFSATDDELLIEQLIQRVLAKRGIVARPEEILITVGGQQALYIAIKLLLSAGGTFGVEDPGYPDVINMARIEGVDVARLPVDGNGLIVSPETGRCKCVYVTPSHHFPTTVTMPLERKRQLLQLAKDNGQFIIEDDYEADISFNRRRRRRSRAWIPGATSSMPAGCPNRCCRACAWAISSPTGNSSARPERFATTYCATRRSTTREASRCSFNAASTIGTSRPSPVSTNDDAR